MARYDIAPDWDHLDSQGMARVIDSASVEQLEKWASDPQCNQNLACAAILAKRASQPQRLEKLKANPFDPRTEVSADAKHVARTIVKHLWIIFVLLPIALGVLWAMLHAAMK